MCEMLNVPGWPPGSGVSTEFTGSQKKGIFRIDLEPVKASRAQATGYS